MIAPSLKTIAQTRKDRPAIMNHFRRLAVHQLRRPNHLPAKRLPDRLMPETNTEQRYESGKTLDNFKRDPRSIRRAWSRRDHDPFRTQLRFDLCNRDAIVATHFHGLTRSEEHTSELQSRFGIS